MTDAAKLVTLIVTTDGYTTKYWDEKGNLRAVVDLNTGNGTERMPEKVAELERMIAELKRDHALTCRRALTHLSEIEGRVVRALGYLSRRPRVSLQAFRAGAQASCKGLLSHLVALQRDWRETFNRHARGVLEADWGKNETSAPEKSRG